MPFRGRCGSFAAALLMAILLGSWASVADAATAMTAEGEPGKGFMVPPSRAPDVATTPGPFSLSAPMRLDVTAFRASSTTGAPSDHNWCTYRITAYSSTKRYVAVIPGEEICMNSQDLFGSSPDVAEFHFLDRNGRELASAYGELVSATCGPCAAQAPQRFTMFGR
ncbi:MAG TPA: hypothetical protein VKF80_08750 [Candidatus Eisenbacteria bacterium]|nr:hypothetical protein [Candidatus Eisenbacteria bacterium]